MTLRLIAGIGNPGAKYERTRHNAGIWFMEELARRTGASFREEKKFFGRVATVRDPLGVPGDLRLFISGTFMNHSGRSVAAVARFFSIEPEELLVAHDELDLPTGVVRLKQGGGLAGHNGLRDITSALGGNKAFNRVRIGVGHPGDKSGVLGHVLGKASAADEASIRRSIDATLDVLPDVLIGEWHRAMNTLHGQNFAE